MFEDPRDIAGGRRRSVKKETMAPVDVASTSSGPSVGVAGGVAGDVAIGEATSPVSISEKGLQTDFSVTPIPMETAHSGTTGLPPSVRNGGVEDVLVPPLVPENEAPSTSNTQRSLSPVPKPNINVPGGFKRTKCEYLYWILWVFT